MQSSAGVFKANLEQLLAQSKNYQNLAQKLNVSTSTLKSWINGLRTPSLMTLGKLADQLGCHASALVTPHSDLTDRGIHQNNVHKALVKNLNIAFLENQCYSLAQKLCLLNNEVSDFALKSYMRTSNYRLPTLSGLDQIAKALKVSSYELLKEEEK